MRKVYSFTTTSRPKYLSSLFLRDYRLVISFAFLRYFYREGPVRFTYSSLLIRLNSIGLIGYILAPIGLIGYILAPIGSILSSIRI